MNTVYEHEADVLVCLEELGQAASDQIEFHRVHTREHEQTFEHVAYEVRLVELDLLLCRIGPNDLPEFVLVVNIADFLIELPGAELTLYIDDYCAKLLALRYWNCLPVSLL